MECFQPFSLYFLALAIGHFPAANCSQKQQLGSLLFSTDGITSHPTQTCCLALASMVTSGQTDHLQKDWRAVLAPGCKREVIEFGSFTQPFN